MDTKNKVLQSMAVHNLLLQKTYDHALAENEKSVTHWKKCKEDHETLIKNLMYYRDKLSHHIMIPLGTKAFMVGKLRNTNEILVSLGDGWFTKQSSSSAIELCTRRVKYYDELLEKLKKEEELLLSRKTLPSESEAFGDERIPEIIEPYNEEAEKEWRIRHREREHEYCKKLAELKKQGPSKIQTEEDLWARLDALDLQEELEEELDRLSEDDEDSGSSEDVSETDEGNNDLTVINSAQNISQKRKTSETCRVSFNIQNEIRHFKDNESIVSVTKKEVDDIAGCNEPIRITFEHSPVEIETPKNKSDEIISPSDIYSIFSRLFNKNPRSILKKNSKDYSHNDTEKDDIKDIVTVKNDNSRLETQPLVQPIGDVIEHKDCTENPVSSRHMSKFKAGRMAAKR